MANPPPPYDDITGISRTVMKDNAQESIGNYNGNARPGEIVVDLTTNPPTPYIGNNIGQLTLLTSAGTYGNIQVGEYLAAGQVGNIIPSGNAVYTLGNATNQWSDLYVSNATIYMNNVPISLTAGNTLTVNGQAILSNDSNATVSTTGNVVAGNLSATGTTNISNVTVNSYTYVPQTWFKGTLSSNQSLTQSVDTILLYNNNSDPLGWGSTAASNGHIVPNKAGWYEIISRVEFSPGVGNSSQQINHQISVNGGSVSILQMPNNVAAGAGVGMTATAFVELNGTTDYITTQCYTTLAGQTCQSGIATLLIVKWIST